MRREGLEQLREPLTRIAGGERSGPASLGPAGAAPGAAAKAFPSPGNDPAVPRTGGFEQGCAVRWRSSTLGVTGSRLVSPIRP